MRITHIDVVIELPEAAAGQVQVASALQQFEDFCVVTQSARWGMTVDVTVRDAAGELVHQCDGTG